MRKLNSPSIKIRKGFTLIELLVVIAIISLLISILLPSLGKARKYARSAACSANLHGIGQSMSFYASDWNDSILGGPTTTGAFLIKNGVDPTVVNSDSNGAFSDNNCPNVIRNDDWMTPILSMSNGSITSAGDPTSRGKRVLQALATKTFICADNQIPATEYSGEPHLFPNVSGSFLMPSYSTSAIFYLYPAGYPGGSSLQTCGSNTSSGSGTVTAPSGYTPKIGNVGLTSRKIFLGDTARFSNCGNVTAAATAPDVAFTFNFGPNSGFNGWGFGTGGACFTTDSGYCTDGDPLNSGATTTYDPRIFAFRHSGGSLHSPSGSFKGNFLFFDGHAETLNDIQAGDPNFWMPSGARWNPATTSTALKIQNSVKRKYYPASPSLITIQ